jgi:hypothetical protein
LALDKRGFNSSSEHQIIEAFLGSGVMHQPCSAQTMDITADVEVEKQYTESDFSALLFLFFGGPSFAALMFTATSGPTRTLG